MRTVLLSLVLAAACGGSAPAPASPGAAKPAGEVAVTDTEIEILDPITWDGDAVEPAASSDRLIDAVAQTLATNASITKVEVVVHGPDATLGAARAKAVLDRLVGKGVDAARLTSSHAPADAVNVSFEVRARAPQTAP